MSLYFVPSIASLVFKLFVLAHVLRGGKVSTLFLSLIIVFAIHNSIEAVIYIHFLGNNYDLVAVMFRLYYVATIFLLLYVLLHSLSVSSLNKIYLTAILVLTSSTLCMFVLFTDIIVAGHNSLGNYSITAIKGSFYWVFSIFSVTFLIFPFLVLIYGYQTATTQLEVIRCKYSLIALAPVLFIFFIVLVLKILDININGAAVIPIATALFLIIVLKTESKHQLSDIRRFLPLSMEKKTANNFLALLDNYMENNSKENIYKDLQRGIEKEIITYSLKKCDYNVAHTAKMMGIRNRSTLYAMINRHDIDLERQKTTTENLEIRKAD